jgi:hypothetical protein
VRRVLHHSKRCGNANVGSEAAVAVDLKRRKIALVMEPHDGGEAADLERPEGARNASSQSVIDPSLWIEEQVLVRLQTAVASAENHSGLAEFAEDIAIRAGACTGVARVLRRLALTGDTQAAAEAGAECAVDPDCESETVGVPKVVELIVTADSRAITLSWPRLPTWCWKLALAPQEKA